MMALLKAHLSAHTLADSPSSVTADRRSKQVVSTTPMHQIPSSHHKPSLMNQTSSHNGARQEENWARQDESTSPGQMVPSQSHFNSMTVYTTQPPTNIEIVLEIQHL
jgi:hypothetical protein